jgi:hypothetical protein
MDKLWMYALSALMLVGVGAAVLECSSGVCGDGMKNGDEQCDKGPDNGVAGSGCSLDCKLMGIPRAQVQVSFELLRSEAPGFGGSTCKDLGADKWTLHLEGPTTDDKTLPCLQPSELYGAVMPGTYQATITLLDVNGAPVSKPVMTAMMDVQLDQMITLNYDFKQGDFLKQDYTGALYFNTYWGGQNVSCAAASPAVTNQALKMVRHSDGMTVPGMTVGGLKLDGTYGACVSIAAPQQVMGMLPWGHYDLSVYGQDASTAVSYCKQFDIFVGVGTATGIYGLVVDPASTDGGACP